LSGHFPFAFAAPGEMPEAQRKEVMHLFSALSPRMQAVALGCIQELLARGTYDGLAPNGQKAESPADCRARLRR
jgi:hypothetical protein